MHQQTRVERSLLTRLIVIMIGYIFVVAGGVLGYYVHWLLFALMPLGAGAAVIACWKATRV